MARSSKDSTDNSIEHWTPYGPPPEGVRLLNLRSANVNTICLFIEPLTSSRSALKALNLPLGRAPWVIRLQSGEVQITTKTSIFARTREVRLPYPEITGVSVEKDHFGRPKCLQISNGSTSKSLGFGLSNDALEWLRNYLIVMVSGLTWKPIARNGRFNLHNEIDYATNPVLLNSELAVRLIDIFLSEVDEVVEKLGVAIRAEDTANIQKHAHWLKSASANAGGWDISDQAQKLEKSAVHKDLENSSSDYQKLCDAMPKFKSWLVEVQKTAAVAISRKTSEHEANSSQRTTTGGGVTTDSRYVVRVLVADDSSVSREVTVDFLGDLVAEVETAKNGVEAIHKWKSQWFDLIFMDCEMDEMNGIDATSEIRRQEEAFAKARVPIIGLTGNTLEHQREAALLAGMDDYITKPFTPEKLEKSLETWLRVDEKHVQTLQNASETMRSSMPKKDNEKDVATASK